MIMTTPWLPDYIAQWYDDFVEGQPYADVDRWRFQGESLIETWKPLLIANPHSEAAKLDKIIHKGRFLSENERRFQALRVASSVFHEMGFRFIKQFGGKEWDEIRTHWWRTGNLLLKKSGHLLPKEALPYTWSWNLFPPPHSVESYFRDFVRWRPSDHPKHTIRVTVLPEHSTPELAGGPLRVAVIPLVESMTAFHIEVNPDPTYPIFSMSLNDPDALGLAALKALERSAAANCDIVVFPELCLTPHIQELLRERLTILGDRPWLVVAGSARTPAGRATGGHFNQALVFNKGRLVLSHHKQYRYSMDIGQQERYGLLDALGGEVNRTEDMEVEPFEIEVLDMPAGRLAILICEDLSIEDVVEPLVVKLGLDWLFVPVLDGCQMRTRWPARFGVKYAEKGACVVVATSLSLVQQHLLSMSAPRPGPGVGLVVVPTSSGPKVEVIESTEHDRPSYVVLP
jgi:predicted amidohydrolase